MASSDRARLAVVGAGRWGRRYIETIMREPSAELRYVVSRNKKTRSIVPASSHVVETWRELFRSRDLDGVIVATPPHTHFEIAMAAIESGLPVLVEKPLTLDPGEAAILCDRAASSDVPVLVGHVHLYSPAFHRLKREVAQMGPIRHIRAEGANKGPIRRDTPAMWDYAPHDLAMSLDIVGSRPIDVRVAVQKTIETAEGLGNSVRIDLTFDWGISAEIHISNIASCKTRLFEVKTDNGTVIYDDTGQRKLLRLGLDGGPNRPIAVGNELPLTRLVREFADCASSKPSHMRAVEMGRDVVDILGRCQSLISGQPHP